MSPLLNGGPLVDYVNSVGYKRLKSGPFIGDGSQRCHVVSPKEHVVYVKSQISQCQFIIVVLTDLLQRRYNDELTLSESR